MKTYSRFTLRTLFGVVTAVSVGCCGWIVGGFGGLILAGLLTLYVLGWVVLLKTGNVAVLLIAPLLFLLLLLLPAIG